MLRSDYIVLAALILMLSAHATTQYLIGAYTQPSDVVESGKAILAQAEINPFAALLLQFNKAKTIYSWVIMPALIGGTYWYFRNKYKQNQEVLEAFAVTLFLVYMINFFNDASYLIGFLAR